jgi:hypothetical protein
LYPREIGGERSQEAKGCEGGEGNVDFELIFLAYIDNSRNRWHEACISCSRAPGKVGCATVKPRDAVANSCSDFRTILLNNKAKKRCVKGGESTHLEAFHSQKSNMRCRYHRSAQCQEDQ